MVVVGAAAAAAVVLGLVVVVVGGCIGVEVDGEGGVEKNWRVREGEGRCGGGWLWWGERPGVVVMEWE